MKLLKYNLLNNGITKDECHWFGNNFSNYLKAHCVMGNVNALGLYDLNRNIRDVGTAYKHLISQWKDILNNEGFEVYI